MARFAHWKSSKFVTKENFHLSLAKYKWEFYETGSEFKNAQVWQKHAKMYEWRHSTHLIRILWRLAWLLCTLFYGKCYTFGIFGTETFLVLFTQPVLCIEVNSVLNGCLARKGSILKFGLVFNQWERLKLKFGVIVNQRVFSRYKNT